MTDSFLLGIFGGLTMLGYLGGLLVGVACGLVAGWNLRGRREVHDGTQLPIHIP
jgi:hypothetical protein